MAVSSRELLLIVRAQNQASGALKRVARDVRGLSDVGAMRMRGQQLRIARDTAQRSRMIAQNELNSIENGRRKLALDRRIANEQLRSMRNSIAQSGVEKQQLANTAALTAARGVQSTKAKEMAQFRGNQLAKEVALNNRMKGVQAALLDNEVRRTKLARTLANPKIAQTTRDDVTKQLRAAELRADRLRSLRGGITSKFMGLGAASGPELVRLAEQLRVAELQVQKLQVEEGRLAEKMGLASGQITAQTAKLKELEAVERDAAARAAVLRSRIAGLGNSLNLNAQKIAANNKAIRAVKWERLAAGSRVIQHLGRVSQYAGLIIGAGLGLAANAYAKFDTQVTLAATQTRKAGTSFKQTAANSKIMQKQILELMGQFPHASQDIAAAAYDLYSGTDVSFKGGAKAMKLFAQAAVAGQTDVKTATDAGITVLNNFAGGIDTLKPKIERMFSAVRYGRMTFGQFATSMSTIAPAARSANQSFDSMVATFAFLTRHLDVAKSRVGYARVLEAFAQPKMLVGLKKAGITIEDVNHHLIPLDQILGKVLKKWPHLAKGGTDAMNFFKNIGKNQSTQQARRALTFLLQFFDKAGKDGSSYLQMIKMVKNNNNEFTQSLKAMEATTGVRWGTMVNQFKAFALMIGQAVIPTLLKLQPYIKRATDWFKNLDEATRNKYITWAAYAAGIALVGSAILFIVGLAGRLIATFGRIGGASGLFLLAILGFSIAINALRGDWKSLNGVIDTFVGYGTGSTTGWIVMLTGIALAANKARKAFIGMSAAAGLSSAAGSGSLLMFGRNARAGGALAREAGVAAKAAAAARGASRAGQIFRGAMAATGGILTLMPGPLKVIAGLTAVAAGAAYLWKRHMDGIARSQQQAKNLALTMAAPQVAAKRFGGTGKSIIDFTQAKDDLQRARIEIAKTTREINKMKGGPDKTLRILDLRQMKRDLINLRSNVNTTFNNLRKSAGAFQDFLGRERISLIQVGKTQRDINILKQRLKELGPIYAKSLKTDAGRAPGDVLGEYSRVQAKIRELRQDLAHFKTDVNSAGRTLKSGFTRYVRDLQTMDMLPKKISPAAINSALAFAVKRGRALSPRDLKLFFKIFADPSSANGTIAKFIASWKRKTLQIEIHAKLKSGQKLTPNEILGLGRGPLKASVAQPAPAALKGLKLSPFSQPIKPIALPAAPARKTIQSAFSKPITQDIKVHIPDQGTLLGMGANITGGIAAGMHDAHQRVVIDKVTNNVFNSFVGSIQKHAGIKSPSTVMAKKVGIPLAQGIAAGLVTGIDKIIPVAVDAMGLFTGALITKVKADIDRVKEIGTELKDLGTKEARQIADAMDNVYASKDKKKQKAAIVRRIKEIRSDTKLAREELKKELGGLQKVMTMKDLLSDMQSANKSFKSFNDSLYIIQSRRIPHKMLLDLRALGVEGAQFLAIIAGSTDKQLKRMVRSWREYQAQKKRSQIKTDEDILAHNKELMAKLKESTDSGANKLLDTWNSFHDTIKGQFGDLFAGPTNLSDIVANSKDMSTFNSDMADYNNNVADLQQKLVDLKSEMAQIRADALIKAIEEMHQAFGDLFAGPWLADKMDWGKALKFKDLQRDLDMQLDHFTRWRKTLAELAGKVPGDLLKQLEALGPGALDMLDILNHGTKEELAKYIATWSKSEGLIRGAAQDRVNHDAEFANAIFAITGQIADTEKQLRELKPPEAPKALTGQDVLNDIHAQVKGWEDYQAALQALKDRGLPQELISQLAALGPDALPYLLALNTLTDAKLISDGDSFVNTWLKSQGLIQDATTQMMKDQLVLWFSHGKNIALQIIAGIMSEQPTLLAFFTSLFQNLIAGKATDWTIPTEGGTPGGVTITGPYTPPELGQRPFGSGPDSAKGGPAGLTTTATSKAPVVYQQNYNMSVTAHQDETLDTTLERAFFRLKNRRTP